MSDSDPYSASRIGRGIAYLVGGKAITSIAGIGTFLLLVRELPVEQFAAYTVLFALVELVDAITGVGLAQVLSRYVPELYVGHRTRALRRLVVLAMGLRLTVLVLFLAAIHLIAARLSPQIGLEGFEWAVRAYLWVVLVRVAATSLFTILESMLQQKIAQLGFGFVTVARFGLLAFAAGQGALDLGMVIVIELVTDLVGLVIMAVGLLQSLPRRKDDTPGDETDWVQANIARMTEFGIKGYLQHLLILPYGSSINRLLVGGALATPEVALFGFAQSIADLMERYLPVKLLAGVIRPVLTARFVRDARFGDLELAANLIFKINAALVCLAAVVIFAGGEQMIEWISAGKYSDGSVGLLLLMCALVLMYSLRFMLDHVSHAVERNGPLIWSNAVITLSVLPGIALLPHLGVYALPSANIVGLAIGSVILVWRLRQEGFDYRHDLAGFAAMLTATVIALGAAETARWLGGGMFASLGTALPIFAVASVLLRPVRKEEGIFVRSFLSR